MTTTTTNPYPNIAPPAGAEAMCDWADWDNEFRFVFSKNTMSTGRISSSRRAPLNSPTGRSTPRPRSQKIRPT